MTVFVKFAGGAAGSAFVLKSLSGPAPRSSAAALEVQ
jgi:hypothetical protein